MNPQDYYAHQGPITNPGPQADHLEGLPTGVEALCRVVQGLILHVHWAPRYGVDLPKERLDELQSRHVWKMLAGIMAQDDRPLAEARPPERRLVGNCRDFTVLLTAMLRHQGVPARSRCGFATYFLPGSYEDHWVCEYWHAGQGRWIRVDPQIDSFQRRRLELLFDPLDLPEGTFLPAGDAWRMCRTGEADAELFGIHDMRGFWFIRGDIGRDLAALNQVELLPWDGWGIWDASDDELSPRDLVLVDQIATLAEAGDRDFERLRAAYLHDARVRVPSTIRSYTPAGPQEIDLAAPASAG